MDQTPETVNYPVYTGMKSAGPAAVRWLGFIAAALLLPLFLVMGWSLGGYVLGLALFTVNRGAALLIDRLARGKMQVTAVGITGMGFISRGWITFGILFAYAQFVDKHVGVVAAVTFLIYFTIDTLARSLAHVAGGGLKKKPQETA
jgi:hypothetical protein